MKKLVIVANWKMNLTVNEGTALVKELKKSIKENGKEIVICPPYTALGAVGEELKGTGIALGSQNMHFEDNGAFTGEVSPLMLKELDVKYVILGHSERRQYFNETNEIVNKKLRAALKHKIMPIFCVGETLEQRESGETEDILAKQLKEGLQGISKEDMVKITIAYEPIWAIGTGRNASSEQAEESHKFIRSVIKGLYDDDAARKLRILYGGSVNEENIKDIMKETDVDGALVGGASLKAKSFIEICKAGK